ncbi:hypothetical protein AVEN_53533-1 [Araneus ventricosus]|uniref:Uncharacterized protein n=1 Tax=Araneus ventricosus TaxID=182803 RepID=A0A4Y2M983_ARAVE|nr:hypothetical protein AVEN_53533-1 [Araneus ventricosus]
MLVACSISSAHLCTCLRINLTNDIIEPVISLKAYFEVPENILLAMLTDERCHIRTLAARRIIKAREIGPDGNCVRIFVIPAVTFGAADYADLIDWQTCYITSPPVLMKF